MPLNPLSWGLRYNSDGRVPAWPRRGPEFYPKRHENRADWHRPVILALARWEQEEEKPMVILGYVGRFWPVWAA